MVNRTLTRRPFYESMHVGVTVVRHTVAEHVLVQHDIGKSWCRDMRHHTVTDCVYRITLPAGKSGVIPRCWKSCVELTDFTWEQIARGALGNKSCWMRSRPLWMSLALLSSTSLDGASSPFAHLVLKKPWSQALPGRVFAVRTEPQVPCGAKTPAPAAFSGLWLGILTVCDKRRKEI